MCGIFFLRIRKCSYIIGAVPASANLTLRKYFDLIYSQVPALSDDFALVIKL